MAPPNVPEVTGYQATAAELHRIADAMETLPGAAEYVTLDIQASPRTGTRAEVISGVKAVAAAVIGPDATGSQGDGLYSMRHHGPVNISVYQRIPYAMADRDAEIARLRAENERLRNL